MRLWCDRNYSHRDFYSAKIGMKSDNKVPKVNACWIIRIMNSQLSTRLRSCEKRLKTVNNEQTPLFLPLTRMTNRILMLLLHETFKIIKNFQQRPIMIKLYRLKSHKFRSRVFGNFSSRSQWAGLVIVCQFQKPPAARIVSACIDALTNHNTTKCFTFLSHRIIIIFHHHREGIH